MTGSQAWRKLNPVTAEPTGARQGQVQGNEGHSQSDLTPAQSQKGLDRLDKQRDGGLNTRPPPPPPLILTKHLLSRPVAKAMWPPQGRALKA